MADTEKQEYGAEQIHVLKGLEAVRMRPAMYIGSTGSRGLHHLFIEVVDNSIDEVLAGSCTNIEVVLHQNNSMTVTDDGRGIPVGIQPDTGLPAVEVVMTILHAGGKFDGGGYKVSGGLHGVGVSCVNALSEWLEVDVRMDGQIWHQRFERGNKVSELKVIGTTDGKGTTVTFFPDKEIFGEYEWHPDFIVNRLRELAYLNGGVRIVFKNEQADPESDEVEQVFHSEKGIAAFVEYLNRNKDPLHRKVVHFQKEREDVAVDIALQYNEGYQEHILSFANNINTIEGGTHVSGFKTALTRCINNYARKNGFLKEKDPNFTGDDVREGLTAVISVQLRKPQFEGQTKTKLGNSDIEGLVNSVVGEGLSEFMEENPQTSRAILDKATTAARARDAARKASDLIKRQSALENSSLPGKLADCSEKDAAKCELFLVEGDSAGGNAKQGRDRKYQAVLPLRGKVLNVEKARIDKALENNEIKSLIACLGAGITNGTSNGDSKEGTLDLEVEPAGNGNSKNQVSMFDLSKLRYHRIIIMTDADVDGAHIRTLLLTFFFRYMRPLIEEGHLYIAQPPLFRIHSGKVNRYAMTENEMNAVVKEMGGRNLMVQRYKGLGEMSAQQLWETTLDMQNRTILQVEMEDAVAADEIFTILMGDKVEPRKEFIQKHSTEVRFLDNIG